jgi:hypothetical protein
MPRACRIGWIRRIGRVCGVCGVRRVCRVCGVRRVCRVCRVRRVGRVGRIGRIGRIRGIRGIRYPGARRAVGKNRHSLGVGHRGLHVLRSGVTYPPITHELSSNTRRRQ